MIVAFYDPVSGMISEVFSGTEAVIKAQGRPCVEIDALPVSTPGRFPDLHDVTHRVVGGALTARPADEIAAERRANALKRLRAGRDMRLTHEVDPVVCNPLRWGALSEDDQAALKAFRQALLDLPATTPDPENTVWPVLSIKA